jgi:uncharacterized protein (DUF1501 family)
MLSIHDDGSQLCDGLNRRDWLRVGGLGALGLSLPALLASRPAQARESEALGKAKACIVLFLVGGPPQHETWDPKPDAPAEIRGDLKTIHSSIPGLRVGELMPRVARQAHRCAILRAVSTNDNAHSTSGYWMLTGMPHVPMQVENTKLGAPNDWPCFGAIVQRLRGNRGPLPAAITIPEHIWNTGRIDWPGQNAGRIGRVHDPWLLTCDPNETQFQVPGLALGGEMPALRIDNRLSLLEQVNSHLDAVDRAGTFARHNTYSRRAFDLLRTSQARQAFDMEREPAAVRDRYGRCRFGQSVLLARRLVEAGATLVQVNWTRDSRDSDLAPMWDTHVKNSELLKTSLMPRFDPAYSALLEDLAERGMLESTLVACIAEFGRTPKINPAGGRDHWGHVFSVSLAGGGIRAGVVHGASDRLGGHPKDGKVEPQDLTATIFHCLGYSPDMEIHDALGRPIPISRGEVIRQILI